MSELRNKTDGASINRRGGDGREAREEMSRSKSVKGRRRRHAGTEKRFPINNVIRRHGKAHNIIRSNLCASAVGGDDGSGGGEMCRHVSSVSVPSR